MKKQKEPVRLLLTWITGKVGKDFVIKHYKYGVVKTKFPDMTKIIASAQQRRCRNLFKEAVVYANAIYADPARKKEWWTKARNKGHVFNYIIKEYMLAAKEAAEKRQEIATIIIRKCFDSSRKIEKADLRKLTKIPVTQNFIAPG
jgi:hypothetical protein